jgi:hypothetical protein
MTPDRQRSRVYQWEDQEVAPRDLTLLSFGILQPMVDAIWLELELKYPPRVERLPPRFSRRLADASRLSIRVAAEIPSWVLLHELAHVLSSTADGKTDGHGAIFMGLYAQLLARYLRWPPVELFASIEKARLGYERAARPLFADSSQKWGLAL